MLSKGHTTSATTGLVEGHARFCRGCGHDLVGLTGERCPQCGRASPALVSRHPPARGAKNGRWLVVAVVVGAAALAAAALKFRAPPAPRGPGPAKATTTLPATIDSRSP